MNDALFPVLPVQEPIVRPLDVEPLTPTIGAVVHGIDLAADPDDNIIDEIEALLVARKVLFFEGQNLTGERHLALARRFGTLQTHPFQGGKGFSGSSERPELIVIETPVVAELWHSDLTFFEEPPLGSILRITDMPDGGGDTMWADMEAVLASLDEATRNGLCKLTAVHDWKAFRQRMRKRGVSEDRIRELQAKYPPVEHPVVRTHPVSGRQCLFVNPQFTESIKELEPDESDKLLARLYRLTSEPEFQVRYRWKPGSVAFWDNRSTQHRVVNDVCGYRRMERATLSGSAPR